MIKYRKLEYHPCHVTVRYFRVEGNNLPMFKIELGLPMTGIVSLKNHKKILIRCKVCGKATRSHTSDDTIDKLEMA